MGLPEIKAALRRRASRIVVERGALPHTAAASAFGTVRLASPNEAWPTNGDGPMLPLCQLNLTEAPYLPPRLDDIALITVFISAGALPLDTANGHGWALRAYSSLRDLVPIASPAIDNPIRPSPIRWEPVEADYPGWEDVPIELPTEIDDGYFELFETTAGSKVGGWPSLIQGEIYWAPFNQHPANPEYVFQIDSERTAGWMWGDAGTGYFGRGTGLQRNTWVMTWQCY